MKLFQKLINLVKKFGINANKIELSANDILNLLAGNEINLGSKKITIKSDNFSVNANGKMSCSDADITGGTLSLKDHGNGGYGGKTGNIEIDGPTHNAYYYSDGIIIRPINGSTASVSKNSINLRLFDGEPDFVIRSSTGSTIIDSSCWSTIIGTKNDDVSINIDGKNNQIGIYAPDIYLGSPAAVDRGGTVMYGKENGNNYRCFWTGGQLQFWVDDTNVGTLSDKRLKKEIKDIEDDFIKIINEVEMKQFKVANRNGLISFGILAQDLMEIFTKYNKNPLDYELVQETLYKDDDKTIYYTINYEQFLVLKQKANDIKFKKQQETIDKLQEKLKEMEDKLNG